LSSQFDRLGTDLSANLDQVELAERLRWQSFYADRTRPCPFFGSEPDENLVEWVESGRLERGLALDIGCGNGRNSIYLARNGFSVTGVDLSEQAIAWACECATEKAEEVRFVCSSIFDAAVAPQSLGFINDSGCFHHLPPHRRDEYAQLIARALRPGGHFGLVCFTPEGGSGLSDEQVYARGSLGGGLGYTNDALREFWCQYLDVVDVRRMNEVPAGSGKFGRSFLWVLLAHAR
jgi:SAM-dependent methyltransferase